MPYYQCFKTVDRTVYCSSQRFKSHAPAATWVADCMAHFNIAASNLLGKPYESDSQPSSAVIWP
jgi:hypothetical protein